MKLRSRKRACQSEHARKAHRPYSSLLPDKFGQLLLQLFVSAMHCFGRLRGNVGSGPICLGNGHQLKPQVAMAPMEGDPKNGRNCLKVCCGVKIRRTRFEQNWSVMLPEARFSAP
jgi:hypothetical protein